MPDLKVPEGYQAVMPHLIGPNARQFIEFTKDAFDADLKYTENRDETIIRHAEIAIAGSVIIFADSTPEYPPRTAGFFVYVQNADDAYRRALASGAQSISALADQSYGRSCGIIDPHGNTWWITSEK